MNANDITRKQPVPNLQLRKEREQRGWTYKNVADRIDLPNPHTVGRWERGESFPSAHYRQALIRVFGKSLEELNLLKRPADENESLPALAEDGEQVPASPAGYSSGFMQPPTRFTSFVGRERELAEICELLMRPDVYVLTLLGTGGIGKTSLATQVALKMGDYFADGVCFVALEALRDHSLVLSALAEALGVQGSQELRLIDQVKAVLQEKHTLLFIDNFEHVITAAALLEELLSSCPRMKVLVTSREALHVSAEREYSIAPLEIPDLKQLPEPAALMNYASIALFVQRVQALQTSFKVSQNNAAAIAELCVRLDGLPLAIELAARMKLFTPQVLLDRFSQHLHLLKSDLRTVDERHRTLYQTIKWSYDLLDAQEQWLFRHLSIFVSGVTLETIEAFFSDSRQRIGDIVEVVRSLLNKSLLQQVEQDGEEARFFMLGVIREYGVDCLRACYELEESKRTYALYFLAEVEEAAPQLKGSQQAMWLQRLEQELGDLRAALGWLIETKEANLALRFGEAFGKFCGLRGYWSEEQRWLKAVLALPQRPELRAIRAQVLRRAGHLAYRFRDLAEARALQEESVRYSREVGDEKNLVGALIGLGRVLSRQNEMATASELFRESVKVARQCMDSWVLANALENLGQVMYHREGKVDEARAVLAESLLLARRLDDHESISRFLTTLVELEIAEGNMGLAREMAQESYELACQLGTRPLIALALDALGDIALFEGEYEQARQCFEQQIAMARELGDTPTVSSILLKVADSMLAQGDFTHATSFVEESLKSLRERGDTPNIMTALSILGDVRRMEGNVVQAITFYREALTLQKSAGSSSTSARCVVGLIHSMLDQGQAEQAVYLFGLLEGTVWLKSHTSLYPAQRADYERAKEKVRALLTDERLVPARQRGQEASLEDIVRIVDASFTG